MRTPNPQTLLLSAVLSLCLGLLLNMAVAPALAQMDETPPETMPPFTFRTLDGEEFGADQLDPTKPTAVMFFDPFCDHCQHQVEVFQQSQSTLSRFQFVLVSTETQENVKPFESTYLPSHKLDLTILRDTQYQFDSWFGYTVAPGILVFDAEGNFKQKFTEEVSALDLLQALKQ